MSDAFHREPCFWTVSTAAETGYNTPDREKTTFLEGKKVRVRHPQVGHQGDYDAPIRSWGEGTRWMRVIKTDGNDVFYVLTNGAADLDPNSSYAMQRRRKARALGWFPFGKCPVGLFKTGEMLPDHFVDQSLLTATPCEHGTHSLKNPCPHALQEKAARTAAHSAVEAERAANFKDPNAKLVEAQHAQTAALVAAIKSALPASNDSSALIEALKQMMAANANAPEPAPAKKTKGNE